MTSDATRRRIVVALVLLWIVMLFAPVATLQMPGGRAAVIQGAQVFGQGWLGPLDLQFGWYANPLFAGVMFVFLKERGSASGISFVALGMMLLLPSLDAMLWRDVLLDEGGGRAPISNFHAGYYGWLAEMLGTSGLAIMMGLRRDRGRQHAEAE